MKIQKPRGTFDILPGEVGLWRFVEDTARRVAALYGYREIRTPIFERTELFVRGVGASTDIVSKEMYSFDDRAGRSLTLRPEGTAPVIRAYIENSLGSREGFTKLFYIGPLFRYEKPQAGRFRQHHQFGAEAIGSSSTAVDAEIIEMVMSLYGELGLSGLTAAVNSVGCGDCRPGYDSALRGYLLERVPALCDDCRRRADVNPLRVFDCKNPSCAETIAGAPRLGDSLCPSCRTQFGDLRGMLDASGIRYEVKPELVRGLDYYTRTTFEVLSDALGAQNAVGGGGRYDNLVELLGGKPTPAIGFGTGLERIVMLLKERGLEYGDPGRPAVHFAFWEEKNLGVARRILGALRRAGVAAEMDCEARSLKSQLRRANRASIPLVVILGGDEVAEGKARLKDMGTGEEKVLNLDDLVPAVRKELSEKGRE